LIAASRTLAMRADGGRLSPHDLDAWTAWEAAVVAPVHVIYGWLRLGDHAADDQQWAQAADAVDRTVEELVGLLERPPGWEGDHARFHRGRCLGGLSLRPAMKASGATPPAYPGGRSAEESPQRDHPRPVIRLTRTRPSR